MIKVDLHGIKHEDVSRIVIRFIEDHWDSGLTGEIIYGNSDRMRELVREVIEEYDLEYREGGWFSFRVVSTTVYF